MKIQEKLKKDGNSEDADGAKATSLMMMRILLNHQNRVDSC